LIIITKDDFASECFQREILGVSVSTQEGANPGRDTTAETIKGELSDFLPYYLICRTDVSNQSINHGLESAGFHLMSVDVTLRFVKGETVRDATRGFPFVIKDLDRTYETTVEAQMDDILESFKVSHYHNNPYLDRTKFRDFYRRWVMNDIGGRSEVNYIALDGNKAIGFLLTLKRDDTMIIDLIWTARGYRRQGVGKALIRCLIDDHNPGKLTVGTQATNFDSLSFYYKMGFTLAETDAIYHRNGTVL